jgi:exosortase
MPLDIATGSLNIRAVVLVGRTDFGRCALAARLPTALWPVLGKTALELLLDHLSEEGVRHVVVCCGQDVSADVESICRRFGSDVKLLNEDLAAGTAGCLRDATGDDPGDVMVVFSSSMVAAPSIRKLVEAHRSGGAAMTMVFNPSCSNEKEPGQPAEIYLCKPEVLSHIPRGGYVDIKEGLIPLILGAGGAIRPVVLSREVGNFHDRDSYLNALFVHLSHRDGQAVEGVWNAERIQAVTSASGVSIHPTAKVCGPVIIAERARILDGALVVGPAVIGSESVVGRGSAVVRSVVWDRVSIGDRCELRESVVDHEAIIPDGSVFIEHAVAANEKGRRGGLEMPESRHGGADRLNVLWQGRMRGPAVVVSVGTVIAAFLWSYWPTVMDLWDVWRKSDEYSAGMLVPLLALYVVWLRRADISRGGIRPAVLPGLIAFLLAQAVRGVGVCFMYGSGERLSIILSVGAIILLLCGWSILKRAVPILLFLCLMLPWPNSIQAKIGLPLQGWATTSAVFCLELAGYPVLRDGNVIHIGEASVAVAEACNGLRMVTAFFVISGLVVLLAQRGWWEKILVFASSVPIAMFCNTLRLSATAVAFTLLKGEYWTKMFHDFGGYAMMPLALALVVGEFWVLTQLTITPDQAKRVVIIRRRS